MYFLLSRNKAAAGNKRIRSQKENLTKTKRKKNVLICNKYNSKEDSSSSSSLSETQRKSSSNRTGKPLKNVDAETPPGPSGYRDRNESPPPNLFPSPPPNVNKSLFLDPTEVVFEPTEMAAANLPAVPQETLNKIRHGKFIDFNSLYAHLERYKINKGYDIVMVMSRGNDA